MCAWKATCLAKEAQRLMSSEGLSEEQITEETGAGMGGGMN